MNSEPMINQPRRMAVDDVVDVLEVLTQSNPTTKYSILDIEMWLARAGTPRHRVTIDRIVRRDPRCVKFRPNIYFPNEPLYRSEDGDTWSGLGRVPHWCSTPEQQMICSKRQKMFMQMYAADENQSPHVTVGESPRVFVIEAKPRPIATGNEAVDSVPETITTTPPDTRNERVEDDEDDHQINRSPEAIFTEMSAAVYQLQEGIPDASAASCDYMKQLGERLMELGMNLVKTVEARDVTIASAWSDLLNFAKAHGYTMDVVQEAMRRNA